jgi:hypothetical protein
MTTVCNSGCHEANKTLIPFASSQKHYLSGSFRRRIFIIHSISSSTTAQQSRKCRARSRHQHDEELKGEQLSSWLKVLFVFSKAMPSRVCSKTFRNIDC